MRTAFSPVAAGPFRPVVRRFAAALFLATGVLPAAAVPPMPELPDLPEQPGQGLTLTITPLAGGGDLTDTRAARLVTLHVPEGAAPTPFLPAGPFRAVWQGAIHVPLRGRFVFSVQGRGRFTLKINDDVLLDVAGDTLATGGDDTVSKRVRLGKGANPLEATFESPGDGAAWVRLSWESIDFPREPVPPTAFSHDLHDRDLRYGERLRLGRELMARRQCLRCHGAGEAFARFTMPELAMDAPTLEGVGARLNPAWMAKWVEDPRALRPDATMPRVFHGTAAADARDVAAFLSTLTAPAEDDGSPLPAADLPAGRAEPGGVLFARLGCIGCHTMPDHDAGAPAGEPAASPHADRVSLALVAAKWQPRALSRFLLEPGRHFAWIRMPDFRLSPQEASDLAAFLLSRPGKALPSDDAVGDAVRGRELVQTAGCLSCHALELPNRYEAPDLQTLRASDWASGCLAGADTSRSEAPNLSLAAAERDALRAFAAFEAGPHQGSLARHNLVEFAERQIRVLRCGACHDRDGITSRWSRFEAEVAALLPDAPSPGDPEGGAGAAPDPFGDSPATPFNPDGAPSAPSAAGDGEVPIDQSRPTLTWTGEKLEPGWMVTFLAGELDYVPRPWLHARMPAFAARARGLAEGLAMGHGYPPVAAPKPAPDPDLAAVGRRLVGRDGGFGCNLCHGVGKTGPLNVFEAQGVNFMHVRERLNKAFYMRWMLKPARVSPGTRMPQFANEQGMTPFFEHFDGDARRQFDAIWQYLLHGRDITPPGGATSK